MTLNNFTLIGILIPFIGTALGAAAVLFLKRSINPGFEQSMSGFSAGVMTAAGVWSLLLPAIEQSNGPLPRFLPAALGFWAGIFFLSFLDRIMPENKVLGRGLSMTVLAVTIHNIPEGMAVGVIFAGWQSGNADITAAAAMALSAGIAIQNIPEGTVVSMPLKIKKGPAFFAGVLSGAVEPIAAVLTVIAARWIVPFMPYLLSFAAGAMIYVVIAELVPEALKNRSRIGLFSFSLGFTVMMILDVALG